MWPFNRRKPTKTLLLELLAQMEKNNQERHTSLMSAITEFATRVNTQFAAIGTAVDSLNATSGAISTSIQGVQKDVTDLKAIIEKLQNSPGTLTPEDQKALDDAEATVNAAAGRVGAVADAFKAHADALATLDAQTETPPTP